MKLKYIRPLALALCAVLLCSLFTRLHRSQRDKFLAVIDLCKDSIKILEAGYATEQPDLN